MMRKEDERRRLWNRAERDVTRSDMRLPFTLPPLPPPFSLTPFPTRMMQGQHITNSDTKTIPSDISFAVAILAEAIAIVEES